MSNSSDYGDSHFKDSYTQTYTDKNSNHTIKQEENLINFSLRNQSDECVKKNKNCYNIIDLYSKFRDSLNSSSYHYSYDLIIVVSFGHYIPAGIIDSARLALNVHPSVLPQYRGSSPIYYSILNGDKRTGVSVVELSKGKMDTGKILLQEKVLIAGTENYQQLHDKLATLGSLVLGRVLRNVKDHVLNAEEQTDDNNIVYARKITKSDAKVNWIIDSCAIIDRKYRALTHKIRLHTEFNGENIKLVEMGAPLQHVNTSSKVVPGQVVYYHKMICVRCKDGWVPFKYIIIPDGRPPMSSRQFYLAYLKRNPSAVVFK
ncbi:methionyl-tRNA formyltransferase-like [Zophobas morio]|uniref:methionyl-tRNA formyltransferase-like n=1 Tax=Zophobas morio TaxID=2755281 RepID=UPI0030834237